MTREEKKHINKKLEQEQRNMEKQFHKTLFGKIIFVLLILTLSVEAIGIISVLSFHIFNLKESVFTFSEKCMKYTAIPSFICMIIYCILLPTMNKNKHKK